MTLLSLQKLPLQALDLLLAWGHDKQSPLQQRLLAGSIARVYASCLASCLSLAHVRSWARVSWVLHFLSVPTPVWSGITEFASLFDEAKCFPGALAAAIAPIAGARRRRESGWLRVVSGLPRTPPTASANLDPASASRQQKLRALRPPHSFASPPRLCSLSKVESGVQILSVYANFVTWQTCRVEGGQCVWLPRRPSRCPHRDKLKATPCDAPGTGDPERVSAKPRTDVPA